MRFFFALLGNNRDLCTGRAVCLLTLNLLLPLWGAATLHAQQSGLDWQDKLVVLRPDPHTLSVTPVLEARFAFANQGNNPVEITTVQSDCGCTVPELAKRLYQPGEGGTLTAKFVVGDRTGIQEKHILVKSSDSKQPVQLTLKIDLPELLRLNSNALSWRTGEDKAPKTVSLEAGTGYVIEEISAISSQALFHATVRTLKAGQRYEVQVVPERTDTPLFAQVPVSCKLKASNSNQASEDGSAKQGSTIVKVSTVYVTVKAPTAAPTTTVNSH